MIEVRIRTEDDATSIRLCDWDASKLNEVIPSIGAWGVISNAGEFQTSDLTGQIRFDARSAYFEIIVNFPDES